MSQKLKDTRNFESKPLRLYNQVFMFVLWQIHLLVGRSGDLSRDAAFELSKEKQ